MSFALSAAAADALSKVLLSTHVVEDDHPFMPDRSENETTSDIDPNSLSAPPVPPQYLGWNAFVSPLNESALDGPPIQPRNFGPSQSVSPGVASSLNPQPLPPGGGEGSERAFAEEDWCGTGWRSPPHPPGPWGELVSAALAFR